VLVSDFYVQLVTLPLAEQLAASVAEPVRNNGGFVLHLRLLGVSYERVLPFQNYFRSCDLPAKSALIYPNLPADNKKPPGFECRAAHSVH